MEQLWVGPFSSSGSPARSQRGVICVSGGAGEGHADRETDSDHLRRAQRIDYVLPSDRATPRRWLAVELEPGVAGGDVN